MTFDQIIQNLKNKVYHPIYLLHGEESYFIDEISDYIEKNVLDEMEREFNLTILYGRDCTVDAIVSNAKRYPMMANHQVIIVKEAQDVPKLEELADYIEKAVPSTILVLAHKTKKVDSRKVFFKRADKFGVTFEAKKLYDSQVPAWVKEFVAKKGYTIDQKSCSLLVEYLGGDLSKIANELEKLMLNISEKSTITPEIIEKYIGISKDYNVFELNKALAAKNVLKANQIITHFALNPKDNPIQKVIPIVFSFFLKLLLYQTNVQKANPTELKTIVGTPFLQEFESAARQFPVRKTAQIIGFLREYDVKSKGVESTSSVEGGDLLKELIFKILH
ncbi:MAG: DNA polymerase III subunit delta [Bacteroidales bacterium]|nr:DNA polymerase III subunit delta [Bacteroidales bacterium]